ncbi:hypothetical protein J8I29_08465 [Labrys sp. LIt4]|uniref:hypothetical protein n=1 Tax=Labrys sp. LIt4 TaxID=2821355 RepID=UPI001ADF109A|nr:hypothetical protein [Labrys sp. LIt4]MBP0579335.1 hypothetical protein [Labrys sp. LIt4]
MPDRKNAVILTHGMGEQMPMATLRGFVKTVWTDNPDIHARRPYDPPDTGNPVWWKPDTRNDSNELYRITTRAGSGQSGGRGPRVDFFEFYWADLTASNTTAQIRDWFMSLLFRWPSQVPADVWAVWLLLWILTLLVLGLVGLQALAQMLDWKLGIGVNLALGVMTFFGALFLRAVVATFGDVAHYVRAKPANIQARREIRKRGLELLRTLSKSGEYDRIILVGHSLGSIIAYDLIRILWAEEIPARTFAPGSKAAAALAALKVAATGLDADPSNRERLDKYQKEQNALFRCLRDAQADVKQSWLISDLVTLGSPLTHAEFLMARDDKVLAEDKEARRLPTSPPAVEVDGDYAYSVSNPAAAMRLHHAAPFAAVRWTNIYDPAKAILLGDIISGPLRENFGNGVRDVSVTMGRRYLRRFFTHTCYWEKDGAEQSLAALRLALKLDER